MVEAWTVLRQHSTSLNVEEMLKHVYEICQELGLMEDLLKLPFTETEQVSCRRNTVHSEDSPKQAVIKTQLILTTLHVNVYIIRTLITVESRTRKINIPYFNSNTLHIKIILFQILFVSRSV